MQATQSWSIIIFCYNEAGTIESVVHSAIEFCEKIKCSDYEIIVVDDGSTDGSSLILWNLMQTWIKEERGGDSEFYFHAKNAGIGRALRTGYKHATKENVVGIPADGQFNLDELIPFVNIENG